MGKNHQKIKTRGGIGGPIPRIIISLVGDSMVGKTSYLFAHINKIFPPPQYFPCVTDFRGIYTVDGQDYDVELWDSQSHEDYDRLRPLQYPVSDCIILCFSVSSRKSFINIENKWIPEVRLHRPRGTLVVLATKTDLRSNPLEDRDNKEDEMEGLIQSDEGKELCARIKAARYLECSSKNMEGLQEVVDEVICSIVEEQLSKRKVCKIL